MIGGRDVPRLLFVFLYFLRLDVMILVATLSVLCVIRPERPEHLFIVVVVVIVFQGLE